MTIKDMLAEYTLAGTTKTGVTIYKHATGTLLTLKRDSHGTQFSFRAGGYAVGSYDGKAVLAAMADHHGAVSR